MFSVAKQRLPDKVREFRYRHESAKAFAHGRMTVADAAEAYLRKIRASVSLKPRSKDYYKMIIDFIRRSWPPLMETDVRKVSDRDCENWLSRYQQQYAPTVVNNSIGTLRAVFDEAVRTGARFSNPASGLSRIRVRQKRLELPSREEFLRFVETIGTAGAGQSKDCANLVRFLAYSGTRIGEARSFLTCALSLRRAWLIAKLYLPRTFLTSPTFFWIVPLTFSAVPRSRMFGLPDARPAFSLIAPFACFTLPLILSLVLDLTPGIRFSPLLSMAI